MSVRIKTPNLDDIFERWKQSAVRKDRKKMEKEFGTKGAVFSLDAISAAEYVKDTQKEAAIYFSIRKTTGGPKETKKEEVTVDATKVSKETYYSFKGSKIHKENWKGKLIVPIYETISPVACKTCKGKGFNEPKCKDCSGSGKIQENIEVLVGEKQDKQRKTFSYPCGTCYGTGKLREHCKDCDGHQYQYKYETNPVPFETIVTGIPVLHSSAKTKYEKEIEKDLHEVIEDVEGIKFSDFKSLEQKAEASLGYYNKNIKKTISTASSDHKNFEKDKDTSINSQIHLFPMIQLMAETKKGSKFEVYSIGSEKKFMIFSNF